MHVAAKIAAGIAAVGTVAGFWWLLRPETDEEKRARRTRLVFAQAEVDLARPYFVEDRPTVVFNVAASVATWPSGVFLVGDLNSIGGATFSVDGTPVPYPPAKWVNAAYTRLIVPVALRLQNERSSFVIRVSKGGVTRRATVELPYNGHHDLSVASMAIE